MQLKWQRKPVELYMIPEPEHGSHVVQNPKQSAVEKEETVDWFDFWLNGREDSSHEKSSQYARWHALRKLQSLSQDRSTQAGNESMRKSQ